MIEGKGVVTPEFLKSITADDAVVITNLWKRIRQEDYLTASHSLRVAKLCAGFVNFLDFHEKEMSKLICGALLHDIGKIKVPHSILYKKEKLTSEEYQLIQQHPIMGIQVLEDHAPYLVDRLTPFIKSHHEKLDGTGYPENLSAKDLSTEIRILTLCDSYDAMVSNRGFRLTLNPQQALQELERCSSQFDPLLVSRFKLFYSASSLTGIY